MRSKCKKQTTTIYVLVSLIGVMIITALVAFGVACKNVGIDKLKEDTKTWFETEKDSSKESSATAVVDYELLNVNI